MVRKLPQGMRLVQHSFQLANLLNIPRNRKERTRVTCRVEMASKIVPTPLDVQKEHSLEIPNITQIRVPCTGQPSEAPGNVQHGPGVRNEMEN
jgi:hypothetical protein